MRTSSFLYKAGLVALTILVTASCVYAAEDRAADPPPSGMVWLIVLTPLFLFILWIAYVTRRSGALKQGGYLAKASEHMDRDERKTDRMIELLESIDRKLNDKFDQ